MPASMPEQIPKVVRAVWDIWPSSILDVGCGFGLYGAVLRQYMDVWGAAVPYGEHRTRIDAIEIHEPYITGLHREVYDRIVIGDALMSMRRGVLKDEVYDLILMLDVLEHFEKDAGLAMLEECRKHGRATLVQVPYPTGEQGTVFGNPHEAHRSDWEPEDFGCCEVLEKSDGLMVLMR